MEEDRTSDAEEGEGVTGSYYDILTFRDTLDYLEAIGRFFQGKYYDGKLRGLLLGTLRGSDTE